MVTVNDSERNSDSSPYIVERSCAQRFDRTTRNQKERGRISLVRDGAQERTIYLDLSTKLPPHATPLSHIPCLRSNERFNPKKGTLPLRTFRDEDQRASEKKKERERIDVKRLQPKGFIIPEP